MIVSGMVKSSFVDYPGQIACVLFVPGCNYDCFYCHNRDLLEGRNQAISPVYIREFLEKRVGLLDAVVISGGEPTLQPDLIPYIKMIKGLGYKVKLDTNGSKPRVVKKLLFEGLCDFYAVDYKAPAARYKEICGPAADPQAVLETINLLMEYGADFQIRTTVIPQLLADDLLLMSKELPLVPQYVLNRYRKPEHYPLGDKARIEQTPYQETELKDFSDLIRANQPHVMI